MRRIEYFIRGIPHNLRKVKWFYQRGKRGWADCDWWSMNAYLIEIIVPMLKKLRRDTHGYPGWGEADTAEKWDAILAQMILGFEAGKRISDDDYFLETNDDILTRNPTEDEMKLWEEKAKADQKIFEDGMKLFTEWYFNLWD